jgi:hypothetical protein
MRNGRQKTFALTVVLACLLVLGWLPGEGDASMIANGAAQEKIIVSISSGAVTPDDTLYTLNPDGSGKTKLFDFQGHPKDTEAGMWHLRVAPDGSAIYFSSDNAYLWTSASRNLFRIASDGSWWDQITPGPNSGQWNQPGPYGTVEGTVKKSNGDPWGSAPVYLEGMSMINANADGSFRFENVPEGRRGLVAYRTGSTVYDFLEIDVVAGTTSGPWNLVPDTDARQSFEHPALFGDRIYHRFTSNSIKWTAVNASAYTEVYSTSGFCTGIPTVDGFDVAPSSGKLAILNYQEGCGVEDTEHRGLYIADNDGNNQQLLIDMIAAGTWCDMSTTQGIFWSPDESKIAFTWCYNWDTYLMVYDASSGAFLGGVYWDGTSYTVNLHGWSPDGNWLLYSHYDQPENGILSKISVNADGSLDTESAVNLLTDTRISGATWGMLKSPQKIYLPLVVRE